MRRRPAAGKSCQLTIIDMDGPGIFVWQDDVKHQYKSTDSKVPLLIERNKGATGDSCVRVVTVDGTAQAGTHFEKLEEEILFKNNVAVKTVKIDLQKFDKPRALRRLQGVFLRGPPRRA